MAARKRTIDLRRLVCSLGVLILCVFYGPEPALTSVDECIACHGNPDLRSRRNASRFVDPEGFAESVHGESGLVCISCHLGIDSVSKDKRIPHPAGKKPDCIQCHQRAGREYLKSRHAKVSKKICYSCHNPHYSASFRSLSGEERQRICLKCHESAGPHRWLPHRQLHFDYLECTSCHALGADIRAVFFIEDRNKTVGENRLTYEQLEPVLRQGTMKIGVGLDPDGNALISEEVLSSFMKDLRKRVPGAALGVRILVLRPTHNFSSKGRRVRDCTLCHSRDASFYSTLLLELPDKDGGYSIRRVDKGILVGFRQKPFMGDLYLLGESKITREDLDDLFTMVRRIGFKWVDLMGLLVISFFIVGACFHASLMFLTRKLRRKVPSFESMEPRPLTIQLWHWIHGLSVILLVLTGIQLRLPDVAPIFATFLNAVNLHNIAGVGVLLDYLLWIAYNLWKREFGNRFLVSPRVFFEDIAEMLHYYGYQIFTGEGFPGSKRRYAMYDPLERAFFLVIMLFLLPTQIVTGILLFDVHATMPAIRALGGLRLVDAVHVVVAYLLVSSLVIHLYFHTLKKYRFAPALSDK